IYDGRVYIGVGEDPEHGSGSGHLWCVDPTKRGDVSPTLVYNKQDPAKPIAYKRLQACEPDKGDFERDNENSALVWRYDGANTKKSEQTMHRTLSSAAIKDGLLFIADQTGIVHCLDARTGKAHWTHELSAPSWSTALIVADRVYIADQGGKMTIFKLSKEKEVLSDESLEVDNPINTTPVAANDVLFIAAFKTLYAIAEGASSKAAAGAGGGGSP